ncbi:MAG: U32 family peptidase [Bifidobacteriaceae bacterium]|jgi:putative protease|nr:U32 family peptidase [Bifidobacteriaceae bacterium]
MLDNSNNIELLAPAGEMDALKSAVTFGANAVYLAGNSYGMRTAAKNFSAQQLEQAINYAHKNKVKVYITINIVPSNEEITQIKDYLGLLSELKADAVIVADIGLLQLAKKYAPNLDIHISTQAGVTNYYTAKQLWQLGAKRVVLARELSLEDIANIRQQVPKPLEIECFIHGAMCMSFSGRCLLSQYLTGRDANHGDCPQTCRWEYKITEITRDNIPMDIIENQTGTTIMSAQDMSTIKHIGDIINAGVNSLKIEGRAKSAYYTGVITNAYKTALNSVLNNKSTPKWAIDEVNSVSHRPYSTGFYYAGKMSQGRRQPPSQTYNKAYIRNYQLIANTLENIKNQTNVLVQTRNYFKTGELIEIVKPNTAPKKVKIYQIIDKAGNLISYSNKPMAELYLQFDKKLSAPAGSFIRQKIK